MSQQCPQCSNPIEADFGVVTCSRCQSVLFVDMEGNVQLSEPSSSQSAAPAEHAQEIPQENAAFEGAPDSFPENHEAPLSVDQAHSGSFQDNWMQDQNPAPVVDSSSTEAPQMAGSDLETSESVVIEEESYTKSSVPESEAATVVRPPRSISDVSEFSNSDQAFGPLSYSVMIDAIDTKEVRQQLAEALNDAKFQWDAKELLKQIKMGRLLLENLNPVKASVLIHRLQDVPVKVSWTQNVYS
jgi:hypothetical protein